MFKNIDVIWSVYAIVIVIFLFFSVFLIYIDRKLTKLEKEFRQKSVIKEISENKK